VSGRGPPWGGMARTDRGAGAAEVPDPGSGKARGRRTPAAQRPGVLGAAQPFDWGEQCGRRCRVFRWSRGRPPKPGHRGGWGVLRAQRPRRALRCGGPPTPADRDGARRLRVCVADVQVVLGPAAGHATFAPGPGCGSSGSAGPGRARWRSRCHPTTPARRLMKYEGFVKKCRHVRLFGTMAP